MVDRATGKVNIPAQCGESPLGAALRQLVLNALDGFGNFKSAIRVTFTSPVDMDTLAENVKMFRRASGTVPADPMVEKDRPVPLAFIPGKTARFSADCSSSTMVDSVTIVPRIPLAQRSTYSIAVMNGVKAMGGTAFGASSTWGLVRQKDNPVTVENGVIVSERTPLNPAVEADRTTLLGLDLLWKAHAPAISYLEATSSRSRGEMLLAWEFTTQTTTTPLDPTVAGTPAADLPKATVAGVTSILGGNTSTEHIQAVATSLGAPATFCTQVGCAAVGNVYNGTVTTPNFQSPGTNPLSGGAPVPGPWSSPTSPTKLGDNTLTARIFEPAGTRPAGGWPTIVFGHGLGGGKEFSYFIASQLAGQGFATVAVDFVASGARAVRTSDAAELGCGGTPNPFLAPQCFAPILSTNLATTRDNIRQSVLDVQTLIASLRLCTAAGSCGGFIVDPAKVGYMGISLGGIIGSVIVASDPTIKGAVLNVPGAGLVDILENTNTLAIRCSTVDGLIGAGIIMGEKWNGRSDDMATGTCTTSTWKTDPGYLAFANTARWVLDSADGANYGAKLAVRRILIQEVVDDQVVPNIGTDQLAAVSGFTVPAAGDTTGAPTAPSAAIVTNPTTSKWLRYTTVTTPVDYSFEHGTLLGRGSPAAVGRIQLDAITYLVFNVKN
ncbi:MAG: hypothetical protein R3B48_12740 [Kofleriaceae bacterium]